MRPWFLDHRSADALDLSLPDPTSEVSLQSTYPLPTRSDFGIPARVHLFAMPTAYTIQQPESSSLRVVHVRRRVIIGAGEDPFIQEFDSERAAAAYLQFMLDRKRRDGCTITSEVVAEDAVPLDPDPLLDVLEWDARRRRATITLRTPDAAAAHCAAAIAHFTGAGNDCPTCVHVVCDGACPGAALSEAFARAPRKSVKHLIFDAPTLTVTQQRDHRFGDLTDLFRGATAAFVTGDVSLRPLTETWLRHLCLRGDPLDATVLAALGASRMPALRTLGLVLAGEAAAAADDAAIALHGLRAPCLIALEVGGLDDVTGFLDALTARALPPSWSRLTLDGAVADEDALLRLLSDRARVFRGLHSLGLPLHGALSPDAAEQARKLALGVVDCDEQPDRTHPAAYENW